MITRRTARAFMIMAGLTVTTWLTGSGPVAAKAPQVCRDVTHEGAPYTVCTIDLKTHDLRLSLKAPHGDNWGNLGSFARAQAKAGRPVAVAMNAGMYHADGRPVGLYVEDGKELQKVSTARGPGNFHLLPNGVFFVTATGAGVLETRAYLRQKPPAVFATQSGPMLVIDGKLHPRFTADGPSQKVRNGVGIKDASTVVFAISNDAVSFGAFGRLFRDELKCANALYLDGSISSLWAPGTGRADELWPVGPIVAAVPKARR